MKQLTGNPDLLRDISTLGLQKRTYNALSYHADIQFVGDLVSLTKWQILNRITGMGETSLFDLRSKLNRIGLDIEMVSINYHNTKTPEFDNQEQNLRDIFKISADLPVPSDNLFASTEATQLPLISKPSKQKGQRVLDF